MFLKALLISILFISNIVASSTQRQNSVVTSVEWVKSHLGDKNLLLIDVRTKEAYDKGHIKGAVNMPVFEVFFTKKMLRVPKLSFLKERFDDAGIDKDTKIVVYDGGAFCWAARAVWVFKLLGHKNASLLEYGYGKYIQKNLPISTKPPKREKSNFIPRINKNMIATKLDVLVAIKRGDIILDGRTKDMYMGKTSIAKRYGHIPTARLFSGSNNYKITEEGNRLKSFDKLKEIYKSLPKNKRIIIYCQDGADAALDSMLMKELGYNTIVYEGSWIEWANDLSLPVENPSKKSDK
ncbi:Thiosulfate sulfurtransferase, rhodanese [hydrothermal vent metagenome]|uniref:Thiosulfate sulfurtransferase, rhodanese n=1 Tax=hydrothermal vent metagenome TaxID=652676 RepID=A0A1W1B8Q7_9ZZZZ